MDDETLDEVLGRGVLDRSGDQPAVEVPLDRDL
jgi:hypothetical protein